VKLHGDLRDLLDPLPTRTSACAGLPALPGPRQASRRPWHHFDGIAKFTLTKRLVPLRKEAAHFVYLAILVNCFT